MPVLICQLLLLVFRAYVGFCGGGVAIGWVVGGNRILACCKASLISFKAQALKLILNSCGDKIYWVIGFWIWVMMVILYMWSLLRYLVAFFSLLERVECFGCVVLWEFKRSLLYWKIFIGGIYEYFIFSF